MAVKMIATVNRWVGLSGDVMPTGVPIGSTFLAHDTQSLYITHDGTNWVLLDATGEVQASPTAYTVLARLKDIKLATEASVGQTPVLYNVTVTTANTEYSQILPANTKKFSIHLRDYTAFRLAYVTGKVATPVAPYLTIPVGSEKAEELIQPASLTLYFAAPAGTKVAEIECWS